MENDKLVLSLPWEEIEVEAQKQIIKNLQVPELIKLVIMPDVHAGYDLPIGGVALLDDVISPSYVGYDIGCGMIHMNFTTTDSLAYIMKHLNAIYKNISDIIPLGFTKHEHLRSGHNVMRAFVSADTSKEGKDLSQSVSSLQNYQLGTLGGGNHFIEFGKSTMYENMYGITIHSGSRGCGHKIASHYMKYGLLDMSSEMGKAYLHDMDWAKDFAFNNRMDMIEVIGEVFGYFGIEIPPFTVINEHHNYAEVTKDGVLHRKGATPAEYDQLGIIPANMKDGVWITRGLGNEKFLNSASHGAGRKMSRAKAKSYMGEESTALLAVETEGIVCPKNTLDEAPWAYKDIEGVLHHQVENKMIEVVNHFKPLLVVKG